MKISYRASNRGIVDLELNTTNLIVELNKDVTYNVSVNKFGELVLEKQQYGDGDSAIILKPSVSNVIRLS